MSSNNKPSPKISPSIKSNLGKLLKKRRLSLKLSLDQVEKQTKIRSKYITQIETSDYGSLKDDVYTKGFVKNYAEFLGFESGPILDMYKSERRAFSLDEKKPKNKPQIGLKPLNSPRFILTPKTLIFFSGLAFVVLILGYIIWQVSILASPPKLTITNPPTQDVNTNFGFISGKAEGGADLFINDSPVLVAPDGSFREKISLNEGANLIKITARNKLGKSVTVDRTIVAKLPTTVVNNTTNAKANEKVDGVRVVVKITKQATWLIINADGKEIFRGTMLAGTTQAFEAANSLKITTGNAGSTQLILSDLLVLNKDLGTVGADGEIKRDLEFKKDTLVQ